MENDDIRLRLARLEGDVSELYDSMGQLRTTLGQLNITIALLEQTLRHVQERDDRRSAFNQRIGYMFIAGLVAAVTGFVVKGGLTI